ncbi:uncharacterized protein LOC128559619 [Mercenaria mercenaria]|uniref:uncharacterized protein LOC128559619 n=1 Tax=Mercenaria mercenaria TaxID=6596 RepID=UPI00234FA2A6|nr:uncharacterized protein LOC128559619 [Mercenaria mercenaria]
MPQDIGPELRLARPKTHHGFSAAHPGGPGMHARSTSASAARKQQDAQQTTTHDNEHHIELLEYEWPDLPPIIHLKDAVCRQRVSQGIKYLLPVDKGKNSIDSKFRTDLRAMFQEPYVTEGSNYDDNRVTKSAKIHFRTNVVDTRWTRQHLKQVKVNLNSESENIRKLYAHSAPAGGRSRSNMSTEKLKTRSSLFLPIKARAHPEALKLRKEVEDIIKSVQEDNDEYDADKDDNPSTPATQQHEKVDTKDQRKSIAGFRASVCDDIFSGITPEVTKHTAEMFETYDQLKNTKPPKAMIPKELKSTYLSDEKNQEIWDWLHYGESITDFEYFLSVCG